MGKMGDCEGERDESYWHMSVPKHIPYAVGDGIYVTIIKGVAEKSLPQLYAQCYKLCVLYASLLV